MFKISLANEKNPKVPSKLYEKNEWIYLYFEIFKLCYEMYVLIFQVKDYLYAKYYT